MATDWYFNEPHEEAEAKFANSQVIIQHTDSRIGHAHQLVESEGVFKTISESGTVLIMSAAGPVSVQAMRIEAL